MYIVTAAAVRDSEILERTSAKVGKGMRVLWRFLKSLKHLSSFTGELPCASIVSYTMQKSHVSLFFSFFFRRRRGEGGSGTMPFRILNSRTPVAKFGLRLKFRHGIVKEGCTTNAYCDVGKR